MALEAEAKGDFHAAVKGLGGALATDAIQRERLAEARVKQVADRTSWIEVIEQIVYKQARCQRVLVVAGVSAAKHTRTAAARAPATSSPWTAPTKTPGTTSRSAASAALRTVRGRRDLLA